MSTDLYVLIPYKDLEALLTAARELDSLREELKLYSDQVIALRGIQTECLEKYQELYKML